MTAPLEVRPHPTRLGEFEIVTATGCVATGPWFHRAHAQQWIDQLGPAEVGLVVALAEEGGR